MAQGDLTRGSQSSRSKRKAARRRRLLVELLGLVVFAAGFILMWSVGSWIVGGAGFPGRGGNGSPPSPQERASGSDYTLGPLLDLRAFRDLSYVPVNGLYVTSYAAGDSTLLGTPQAHVDLPQNGGQPG